MMLATRRHGRGGRRRGRRRGVLCEDQARRGENQTETQSAKSGDIHLGYNLVANHPSAGVVTHNYCCSFSQKGIHRRLSAMSKANSRRGAAAIGLWARGALSRKLNPHREGL
jgi:hypothetical protein